MQHRIKKSMEHKLEKYKQPYSKYYNYPSCDSKDWMLRYWGENYSRLLTIKVIIILLNIFSQKCNAARLTGTLRICSNTARVWAAQTTCAALSHSRTHKGPRAEKAM